MKRVKFEIDPNDQITGVKAISLVDNPALKSEFVAFSAENPKYIELKALGYKQVVAGMALIPDKNILRVAQDGEEYLAYFTKDSIENIRNKFHKQLLTNEVNTDHNPDGYIDAYLIESMIIDSPERLADVAAKGIKDPVLGSWYVAYKIDDPETFARVLSGELNGFSVEIFANKVLASSNPSQFSEEQLLKSTINISGKDLIDILKRSSLLKQEQEQSKGRDKGIFERKLKMIESEINN